MNRKPQRYNYHMPKSYLNVAAWSILILSSTPIWVLLIAMAVSGCATPDLVAAKVDTSSQQSVQAGENSKVELVTKQTKVGAVDGSSIEKMEVKNIDGVPIYAAFLFALFLGLLIPRPTFVKRLFENK